jgi:hypothetical protein
MNENIRKNLGQIMYKNIFWEMGTQRRLSC